MVNDDFEKKTASKGFLAVCGIDEAGRGPLAGPVFAAAVILPDGVIIEGLDDSKKLTEKKREQLFDEIIEKAVAYNIASVDEREIDEINILRAAMKAMKLALEGLPIKADFALIDGNTKPDLNVNCECIIKGDQKSISIAAASILAKVSRDRFMLDVDKEYPQYLFCKHKGYGTKIHYEKIEEYGICIYHRRTFLKKLNLGVD